MVVMEEETRINFIEGSFDLKLKVVIHFLRVKSDWRAASLPPNCIFFPEALHIEGVVV
jgi:hypothetical protein